MECRYCNKTIKGKYSYFYKGMDYCSMKCIYQKENIPEHNKYDRGMIKAQTERLFNDYYSKL
jgi:hypothetical protein